MILWLDLETTGTDENKDEILELGAILTNQDDTLSVISEYHKVYKTAVPVSSINQTVFRMHTQNLLWYDVLELADCYAPDDEANILEWLGKLGALKGGQLAYGGSGVSHFDRRFIANTWPSLDKRLTFWAYDVGAMRRLARLGGVAFGPEIERRAHPEADMRSHRARLDAYDALEEARAFITAMRGIDQLKKAA